MHLCRWPFASRGNIETRFKSYSIFRHQVYVPIFVIPLLFLIADNYLLAGVIDNNNNGDENNEYP